MMDRRGFLAGMLAGVAWPAAAEAPDRSPRPRRRGDGGAVSARSQPEAAERLIAEARLGAAVTSYILLDAASGAVLEGEGADLPQPPASVTKAVTALYALDRLGAGYRFATRLFATGPVVAGRIEGDLILAGTGDPSLSTDHLAGMAAELAARGVRGVTGRFLIHAGGVPRFDRIDADQPDHVGYNPALSGLNLNFNRVHFEWRQAKGGYTVAMDARTEKFVPPVRMARMQVVAREVPLFTYEPAPGVDNWTVARAALGKGGSRWMPVRHPEIYAGEVFQTLAAGQGITLPEAVRIDALPAALPAGAPLVEHLSEPLDAILRDMLKFSTNLTAEVVGLTASGQATLAGSGAAMTEWARARHGVTAQFVDHSGLGSGSRVSVADLARVMQGARATPLPGLLRDMGMRDAKGREIKDHPVRVLAKSGTLNFVSGLAGFIRPPGGRDLVFAVISADVARRDALADEDREAPPGGPEWIKRARVLQGRLIDRWARLYG
jgi:D-alanyl-D-alanine carboxypeptidase/D-alanyl-D-alanine-endopeptidase (penicillin-binding protein 4)